MTVNSLRYHRSPAPVLTKSYNLAGELINITNPVALLVSFNCGKIGRVTSVSCANYAGPSYIDNISYHMQEDRNLPQSRPRAFA